MKIKEVLVFVMLAASIVSAFGGFALVSRGEPMGWIGVAVAVPILFVVQKAMRLGSSQTETIHDTEIAKPRESPSAEG
jgi:hypothetical protein